MEVIADSVGKTDAPPTVIQQWRMITELDGHTQYKVDLIEKSHLPLLVAQR